MTPITTSSLDTGVLCSSKFFVLSGFMTGTSINAYPPIPVSSGPYEKDDEEADGVYVGIDRRMDGRRKERREQRFKEEVLRYREERPKIQQQFAGLKRDLAQVSSDEWASIPEVGDVRNKKQRGASRAEKFTPVPDVVLRGVSNSAISIPSIDPRARLTTPFPGSLTPGFSTTSKMDLNLFGEEKKKFITVKLDQVSSLNSLIYHNSTVECSSCS